MPDGAPGFLRHIAAVFYDAFLLLAILFLAVAIALPVNHGEAFTPEHPLYPVFLAYLLLVCFGFYGWFWTHGGQTLGLKAWKLQLVSDTQAAVSWQQAALRFAAAIISWGVFGLGFVWQLVDKEHLTWHDRASKTRLVFVRDK